MVGREEPGSKKWVDVLPCSSMLVASDQLLLHQPHLLDIISTFIACVYCLLGAVNAGNKEPCETLFLTIIPEASAGHACTPDLCPDLLWDCKEER